MNTIKYLFENFISFIGITILLFLIVFLLSLIGEKIALYSFCILAPLFYISWLIAAFKGAFKKS